MSTDQCPNFVMAETERAKKPLPEMNDDDEGNDMADVDSSQPVWMQVIKPNVMFDDFQNDDFTTENNVFISR